MKSPRPASDLDGDEIVRSISSDGSVLVRTCVGTRMVAEATSRHQMAPTARTALGRALLGAVLLAVGGKDSENVQLEFRGSGPLGALVAMSDDQGRARGYVGNPAAHPPLREGRMDIAGAIGVGLLTVSRRRASWPSAHTGTVHLAASEVAQDLAHYLAESEQIPSAVGLGAAIDAAGQVEAAGGFLVQALPGADDAVVAAVEANVGSIASTTELVRSGARGDDLLDRLLEGIGSRDRARSVPSFHCPCTRGRALNTLALLGWEELSESVGEGRGEEVRCHFCGERYVIEPEEVRALFQH